MKQTSTLKIASPKGKVDIRALKSFVMENYPKGSALYDIMVTEEDFIEIHEFCAKMGIWLKLSRRQRN